MSNEQAVVDFCRLYLAEKYHVDMTKYEFAKATTYANSLCDVSFRTTSGIYHHYIVCIGVVVENGKVCEAPERCVMV